MFKGRYGNVLTVILVMVIVLIVGLIGWFAYDLYKQNSANDKAHSAVEDFKKNTVREKVKEDNTVSTNEPVEFEIGNTVTSSKTKMGNTKTYLENYEVKGIIEIPKTGIEYPILAQVTKRSLELAVAILYGPGLNEVGNTVILGHNYRNSLFFSDNDKLSIGDEILITDQNKNKVTYLITKMYETDPDDTEYMLRDTGDAREISLSTCTDDSKARLVIWAREKGADSNNKTADSENDKEDDNKENDKKTDE